MKRIFTILLLLGGCALLLSSCAKKITTKTESTSNYGQTGTQLQNPEEEQTLWDDKFCPETDKLPQFPGGEQGFVSFIRSNVKYPQKAMKSGIQGRVLLSVIINEVGEISAIEVVESIDPSLDKEAIRVVKKMPRWEPGERNGEKVRVRHTIPIVFRLR